MCAALVVTAVAALSAPFAAGGDVSSDRATTHAYLEANYRLALAEAASSSTAEAAGAAAAAGLGRECAGVLSGAPSLSAESAVRIRASSPRQLGEARRAERQRSTIEEQLFRTVYAAALAGGRPAEEAFAATVAPLTWSDTRIAAKVRQRLSLDMIELGSEPPSAVCEDMRSWAGSGFKVLAAHSKGLLETFRSLEATLSSFEPPLETLLRPFESAADRKLVQLTNRAADKAARSLRGLSADVTTLRRKLGIVEPHPARNTIPKVLGRGPTAAGGTFTITTVPTLLGGRASGCRLQLSVEYEASASRDGGVVSIGTSGGQFCARGHAEQRDSHLQGCSNGQLTITASAPSASRVRLLLANGRTITSRTVFVRPRDGGPATVYAQALPRSSARPVSLTELGARGQVLAVVRLRRHARCPSEQQERPSPVAVAHGTTPDGRPFAIEALPIPPPVSHGEVDLTLDRPTAEDSLSEETFTPSPRRDFEASIAHECPPDEFAIVYGRLRGPAVTVLVRTSTGVAKLAVAPLPAALHSAGNVAYGALASFPLELIVQDAAGRTLYTESLTTRAAEQQQFCEGYAES